MAIIGGIKRLADLAIDAKPVAKLTELDEFGLPFEDTKFLLKSATAKPVASLDELSDTPILDEVIGSFPQAKTTPKITSFDELLEKEVAEEFDLGDTPLPDTETPLKINLLEEIKDIEGVQMVDIGFQLEQEHLLNAGLITKDEAIENVFNKIDEIGDEFEDAKLIGIHNQNAELRLEEKIFEHDHQYDDTINFKLSDLSEEQEKGLAIMAHAREERFISSQPNRIRENYEFEEARYPSRETAESLAFPDFAAVNFYTQKGDEAMNTALRTNSIEPGSDLEAAINMTQSALSKLPSWGPDDGDGVLYRRVSDRNVKAIFDELEVGSEYTEKAFTSTSRVDDSKSVSPLKFIIKPKEAGNAHGIEGLSSWPSAEKEVLYEHGTSFRIVKKEQTTTTFGDPATIIYVEEI